MFGWNWESPMKLNGFSTLSSALIPWNPSYSGDVPQNLQIVWVNQKVLSNQQKLWNHMKAECLWSSSEPRFAREYKEEMSGNELFTVQKNRGSLRSQKAEPLHRWQRKERQALLQQPFSEEVWYFRIDWIVDV